MKYTKRGKCDYCNKRRLLNYYKFCKECVEESKRVVDKYFDGDFYAPLVYALKIKEEKK